MENKKRNILLIVNPCAGRTRSRVHTFDVVNQFPKDDYEFFIHETKGQGDATEIVRHHAEGMDLVICCGGDGTLNETINGVMDLPERLPIGYIPCGSTNDLASTLGIPTKLPAAAELIRARQMNSYDIGLFNNRYYSYVASFGAFTRSSYATSQRMKNLFGHAAYIFNAVFKEWTHIKTTHMKIEYDDGEIEGDFSFGAVSNSTSVAGVFRFDKNKVRLNDGKFEVLLVRKAGFADAPYLFSMVRKKQYDGKRIIMLRTSKVKFTAEHEIPWTLDGEYGGEHKTVMVHVLSKAIDICSPDDHELFEPITEEEKEAASQSQ